MKRCIVLVLMYYFTLLAMSPKDKTHKIDSCEYNRFFTDTQTVVTEAYVRMQKQDGKEKSKSKNRNNTKNSIRNMSNVRTHSYESLTIYNTRQHQRTISKKSNNASWIYAPGNLSGGYAVKRKRNDTHKIMVNSQGSATQVSSSQIRHVHKKKEKSLKKKIGVDVFDNPTWSKLSDFPRKKESKLSKIKRFK